MYINIYIIFSISLQNAIYFPFILIHTSPNTFYSPTMEIANEVVQGQRNVPQAEPQRTIPRNGNLVEFTQLDKTLFGGGGLVAQSCPTLVTPWTVARQASLSLGFPRQVYWSGLPVPSPGNLPDPGIEPISPALQADSLLIEPPGNPGTLLRTSKSFLLCIFFSLEWTCLQLLSCAVPLLYLGADHLYSNLTSLQIKQNFASEQAKSLIPRVSATSGLDDEVWGF